jgi:hypothetical protein
MLQAYDLSPCLILSFELLVFILFILKFAKEVSLSNLKTAMKKIGSSSEIHDETPSQQPEKNTEHFLSPPYIQAQMRSSNSHYNTSAISTSHVARSAAENTTLLLSTHP